MSEVICPSCGSPVAASALLCPKCGRPNVSTAFAEPNSTPAGQPGTEPGGAAGQGTPPATPAGSRAREAYQATPKPHVATQPPEQPGGSVGESLGAGSASPVYKPELPLSLRPGTLYAGPNVTVEEAKGAVGSGPLPAPQPHLGTGGHRPMTAQGQHDREETMRVRQREMFDAGRPAQPQPGYGGRGRSAYAGMQGRSAPRRTSVQPAPWLAGMVVTALVFVVLAEFLGSGNLVVLACIISLMAGYAVFLWRQLASRGRR